MEKVKITTTQEEALKTYVAHGKDGAANLDYFISHRSMFQGIYFPLKDFTTEQFAYLLIGYYEVTPEFSGGDWAESTRTNNIFVKVLKVANEVTYKFASGSENRTSLDFFIASYKKVTEDWRIKLLEKGRPTPKLEIGDKFCTKAGKTYTVRHEADAEQLLEYFNNGEVVCIYPIEFIIDLSATE